MGVGFPVQPDRDWPHQQRSRITKQGVQARLSGAVQVEVIKQSCHLPRMYVFRMFCASGQGHKQLECQSIVTHDDCATCEYGAQYLICYFL